jgi:hypothetical protein
MGTDQRDARYQAAVFGRYLLGTYPCPAAIELYDELLAANPGNPDETDRYLLDFALRHHWSIGLIDSGLAFTRPDAEIRRRLHLMFAILECMPEHTHHFISQDHKRWSMSIISLSIAGVIGAFKALAGYVLVSAIA